MAKIVLGIGTSHGPMLSTPPEQWGQRVEADRRNPELYFQGKPMSFDQLLKARRGEQLANQLTEPVKRGRFEACQSALDKLAGVFQETKPDVAVIFGDDQLELIEDENMPAFLVYWGEQIDQVPPTPEQLAAMPPGIAIAVPSHNPPDTRVQPGCPELGLHLIRQLIGREFDVAHSKRLPPGHHGSRNVPHAYGFVYRRIMDDKVIPNVPIFINTFYPPNQPTLHRTYEFGKAIGDAIRSWQSDARVAVIASGGLTHFVIEEDLDHIVLEAMQKHDDRTLARLPEERFNSGTSEIRNWIALAGAIAGQPLDMKLVDYVPCYRSEAGTGNAMGFAFWR
ncbi:MAG TPA: protocatechuate 3,4-dioxygenase [Chloroflexota bacterium]|nr:protocatechuate 3,4-dioxygenase [Chloroflexota bacterium]